MKLERKGEQVEHTVAMATRMLNDPLFYTEIITLYGYIVFLKKRRIRAKIKMVMSNVALLYADSCQVRQKKYTGYHKLSWLN